MVWSFGGAAAFAVSGRPPVPRYPATMLDVTALQFRKARKGNGTGRGIGLRFI